jgi:Dyp-type peroxidase family
MAIDLNTESGPIDPNDPKYAQMLANLQGNILKSHGRDYTVNIFLSFTGTSKVVKRWLTEFTQRFVTSAFRQHHETAEYKITGLGRAFATIHISAAGYRKLGFDPAKFVEPKDGFSPATFFRDGMERARTILADPPTNTWDNNYAGRKIHAMILLADEDPKRLKDVQKRVEQTLKGVAKVLIREDGVALRDESNKPIEHFGYRDGISQPLYFKSEIPPDKDQWDPSAALNLVLVKDPLTKEADSFGSYFVFRKLEQNVKAFDKREDELADALGLTGDARERAGALAVGRFENGIPVTLDDDDTNAALKDANNFNYQSDQDGAKCPFQAHIRKTNPRGDTGFSGGKPNAGELGRRVTRRGITYGKRKIGKDGRPTDKPSGRVGLLFMCFQQSIPNQFGFMQVAWANNPSFVNPIFNEAQAPTGLDPIIGQGPHSNQNWPPVWGNAATKPFDFSGFVNMKGGEYFFAPSIAFLRSLGEPLPSVANDQAEFAAAEPKQAGAKKGK